MDTLNTEITQPEVEALIATTHSDNPFSPLQPKEEVESRFDRFCFGRSLLCAPAIRVYHANHEDYSEWTPDNIEALLDEIDSDRLQELLEGAEPTQQESTLFEERGEEKAGNGIAWAAYLYRLAAPEGSSETRQVYFANVGIYQAQNEEIFAYAGPFPDDDEAVEWALAQYEGNDDIEVDDMYGKQ